MDAFLTSHPFLISILGAIIGGVLTLVAVVLVTRKYQPLENNALQGVVTAYEKQIAANERALQMQKVHFETELSDMKQERDNYRSALHDSREKLHAAELKVQELETRPNLTNLETLMKSHTDAIARIGDSLDAHMSSDKKFFSQFEKSLKKIANRA